MKFFVRSSDVIDLLDALRALASATAPVSLTLLAVKSMLVRVVFVLITCEYFGLKQCDASKLGIFEMRWPSVITLGHWQATQPLCH